MFRIFLLFLVFCLGSTAQAETPKAELVSGKHPGWESVPLAVHTTTHNVPPGGDDKVAVAQVAQALKWSWDACKESFSKCGVSVQLTVLTEDAVGESRTSAARLESYRHSLRQEFAWAGTIFFQQSNGPGYDATYTVWRSDEVTPEAPEDMTNSKHTLLEYTHPMGSVTAFSDREAIATASELLVEFAGDELLERNVEVTAPWLPGVSPEMAARVGHALSAARESFGTLPVTVHWSSSEPQVRLRIQ